MKTILFTLISLAFSQSLFFSLHARATDADEIKACLKSWGHSPFTEKSPYRIVAAKVKVMGIGGDIYETVATKQPELVLVRPAVTVMAKTAMHLGNPNGWYCLKGKVAVLGKMEINLHCSAHMAASEGGATVLGANDANSGTTVLGSTRVNRVGDCK